ncbi:MAG: hypothetical protein K9H06_20950 [Melioribacteraceae bacterium]|nr:hypothetical protein [Melioribacteraceae bacterium]
MLDTSHYVFVNGEQVEVDGITIDLSNGEYDIEIRKSLRGWNDAVYSKHLTIDECDQDIILEVDYSKNYYLDTDPQNVYVYNSDTLIGYTPLFIKEDLRTLTLQKRKYDKKKITLTDFKNYQPVNLNYAGGSESLDFVKSPWFKVLIGSAVVLGAGAAYFKIQADQEYENYLSNNSAASLDKTDKYDLYSGIALTGLQINFGMLIYFFLTE